MQALPRRRPVRGSRQKQCAWKVAAVRERPSGLACVCLTLFFGAGQPLSPSYTSTLPSLEQPQLVFPDSFSTPASASLPVAQTAPPPCLAAAPPFTSLASATAPAPATLPTSSNGMSSEASPAPILVLSSSSLSPSPSVVCRLPEPRTLHPQAALLRFRVAPRPALTSATSVRRRRLLPPRSLALSLHRPSRPRSAWQSSLTVRKVWPPRPLRHPGPPLCLEPAVSLVQTRLASHSQC